MLLCDVSLLLVFALFDVSPIVLLVGIFFFNDTATTEIYTYRHTLSLHYALPISYRFSAQREFPYTDTHVFARSLVDYAPERLLWGSDWPHPDPFDPMPNDGDLFDLLLDWAPAERPRQPILVDKPAALVGFPPALRPQGNTATATDWRHGRRRVSLTRCQ